MGHIAKDPLHFSENYVASELRGKLENNYLQTWNEKSTNAKKLSPLITLKKNNYKRSNYLNTIIDKDIRRKLTKLRLSCSNLNGHKFLNKNSTDKCPYYPDDSEDLSHFFLYCPKYKNIQDDFMKKIHAFQEEYYLYNNDNKLIGVNWSKFFGGN